MLYYLFSYLDQQFDFPGAGLFQFISFRTAMAILTSLFISTLVGKRIIRFLQKQQVSDEIRALGLKGENEKVGTPTMGGVIILLAIIVPTLLFTKLHNIYVIVILITTVWMGLIGFLDDYIKVFKKDKAGLAGKFKILGQVGLGLIVGTILYVSPQVVVRENPTLPGQVAKVNSANSDVKTTATNIPFFKNNEWDYALLLKPFTKDYQKWSWLIFIPVVIIIVTAVSNGANITDGLDGLATGVSAIIGATLGILAYVSGNVVFADYLNILYIPNSGELVVFAGAFLGACIGFLWYNSYPAQVFMGDTGSLAIGGIIAAFAVMIRKELLIPVLCGIFLVENLSVIMQVGWFKYTKKKFGAGRRIFLMSPLHHHYQKLGYNESKIVTRFWIIGIFLAVITIITLKIR
ncbi:MAG: phospho-N-acetylmuramoyl-pentapeptide-transferase [Sphingobacteriales bacterium]|jgi:phospho-N-acetylmuramoyl-pentapeptide-transferase